ncbi:PilZ domain-containing protein [Saccharospirillum mangrovi]|uniref:PilZ domain-containing protein n=1 Tax=Saccharospirillum mangrovi TaxID=2161747 RepID=UPI000D364E8D|nr:PilZ domain-containing protein [Saccharospirillum mangrovi]
MTKEQRRFQRIAFDARVALEFGDQHYLGVLRDISLKGALIMLNETTPHIATGQIGQLKVRLDQGDVEMQMEITVAYVHPQRQACGVNILSMDVDTASHLRRLVEVNLGDAEALQRELSNLIDAMEAES